MRLILFLLLATSALAHQGGWSSAPPAMISVTQGTTRTLLAAETGAVVRLGNGSTDSTSGVRLPPAVPGLSYRIVFDRTNAQTAPDIIDPAGNDTISAYSGTTEVGSYAIAVPGSMSNAPMFIECFATGRWVVSEPFYLDVTP